MADISKPVFYSFRGKLPSAARISQTFGISTKEAEKIRGYLTGKIDLMESTSARMRQLEAYNPHSKLTLALEAVNEAINGYGVEYIAHVNDGFTDSYGIEYINMGDTYSTTILYNRLTRTWSIGSWGDIVERYPHRYK